ncbi:phosphate signaling complex protein PhoU [Parvularcula sp. LCG005]|uniref:phosphate signaling complex protein PhoU n=1 Tax=Parvularcula sp. LCG005 TaxID=3078805 RepID=UPI002943054D|nr:phosphate signaling complex protein PhoU [Parvularcula sp. LCG005]WOI52883.1 phosphate signaling complex protein PhoU [Parvularcula sp. LCG005]
MPFGLIRSVTGRLEKVDIALATMGGVVEQQLADSIEAFERRDSALAAEVVARDRAVDEHERDIERQVLAIFEDRHPTGAALRRSLTALRIAAEMERVGDLAKNIARRTLVLNDVGRVGDTVKVVPVVARMGRRALTQFSESLDALFKGNAKAALAVRDADGQIDELYNSIFRELLETMGAQQAGVLLGTHLVFIAKNFERIGDHATNIAERVHFSLTGEEMTGDRIKTDVTSFSAVSSL